MARRIVTSAEETREDRRMDLSEGLRPKYLKDYIGQEKTKSNLRVYIDAAKASTTSCSTVLRASARRRLLELSPMRWEQTSR